MSTILAYRLTSAILCVGLILGSAEYVAISTSFSDRGILGRRVIQFATPYFQYVPYFWNAQAVTAVAVVRALAAVAAVTARPGTYPFWIAILLATASHLTLERRRWLGGDGSDQMNTILLVACLLAVAPWGDSVTQKIGIVFISGQAILSYAVSGISKLISPVWRSGAAIPKILSTSTYGSESLAVFLAGHGLIARAMDWAVILTECLFPLILLLPPHAALIVFGLGVVFHGSIAAVMGLNTFFWAFCATYPSLYWVTWWLHK